MTNCLFIGNAAGIGGGIGNYTPTQNVTVTNCTFSGNSAVGDGGGVHFQNDGINSKLDNCVFWDNSDGGPQDESAQISINEGNPAVTYTDIMGLTQSLPFCVDPDGDPPCEGNIGADPKFLGGPSGDWSDNATFDSAKGQTTFTDIGAGFGDLVDNFLNPATAQPLQSLIVSNTPSKIVVWGDFKDLGSKGTFYQINDYRLDSSSGSPCIDAADNNAVTICSADLDGNERIVDDPATTDTGNGGFPFIDMGAYEFGGDPELDCDSLGIADSCCPEDFNGDGMVGAFDLAVLLGTWGACPDPCSPGDSTCECRADLDNNCEVKAFDLALLLGFWGPCP